MRRELPSTEFCGLGHVRGNKEMIVFFFQDFEAFAISEETVQKYQTFEFDGLSFVLELD